VRLPVPDDRVAVCAPWAGRALTFGLRPEHIGVRAADDGHSVAVAARVQLVEPLGSDTLALVRLRTGTEGGEVTGRFPPEAGLAPGASITVHLAAHRMHLFDPQSGVAVRGST